MLGPDKAIWDDGEWIGWDEISRQIEYKEWRARYPEADLSLVPVFEQLLMVAEEYHVATGRHLQVYGDIGELFGAITYGIKLHRNNAEGSDGRVGNDFIEVKTITPFKKKDVVTVDMNGNFSKLLIVKIDEEFQISHRLIKRKNLPKSSDRYLKVLW